MNQTLVATDEEAPREADLAFDRLYRSSRDDVYAYVASLLRDRAAAEEVTATAFERAYRKRSRFDPSRGEPRAWLFGIARNAALDELRRRGRQAELAAEPADLAAAPAHESAEASERRLAVSAALADAGAARARADRAQVLRRPRQRRDRRRARRLRVERRHQAAPSRDQAEGGMRWSPLGTTTT